MSDELKTDSAVVNSGSTGIEHASQLDAEMKTETFEVEVGTDEEYVPPPPTNVIEEAWIQCRIGDLSWRRNLLQVRDCEESTRKTLSVGGLHIPTSDIIQVAPAQLSVQNAYNPASILIRFNRPMIAPEGRSLDLWVVSEYNHNRSQLLINFSSPEEMRHWLRLLNTVHSRCHMPVRHPSSLLGLRLGLSLKYDTP